MQMHIKIGKAPLAEALNSVQAVVGSKTTLRVLENVKLEAKDGKVELVCSDLDTTLISNADCEVLETGATTIPVKQFAAAVGKLCDGIIDISVDGNDCATISAGSSVFKFKGLAAREFPTIPSPDGLSGKISCGAIREMLRKTAFATSQDDTRRTLQGVLMDFQQGDSIVRTVGTDGRRLAMLDCSIDTINGLTGQFIIPHKAVDLLLKKLPKDGDAELVQAKGQLLVKTGRIVLLTKLIDDTYPNYRQVIPKGDGIVVTINRLDLLGALERISVFASSIDSPSVAMLFADNSLQLNSGDTDLGSSRDEIAVKYEGEKIELRFNPQYIRDVLMAMDEDEIDFKITTGAAPTVIRKAGMEDFTYVVMPLRI